MGCVLELVAPSSRRSCFRLRWDADVVGDSAATVNRDEVFYPNNEKEGSDNAKEVVLQHSNLDVASREGGSWQQCELLLPTPFLNLPAPSCAIGIPRGSSQGSFGALLHFP
jgi:hypothetical protein